MAKRITLADFARMSSFGTFKPTGYAVLAYPDEATARTAEYRLHQRGFAADDVLGASSRDVFPHVDAHLEAASGLAGAQGYEVVLMKRYLELAASKAFWLLVWAPADEAVQKLKPVLDDPRPLSAAHYGRLLIEDLSESPAGAPTLRGREQRQQVEIEATGQPLKS